MNCPFYYGIFTKFKLIVSPCKHVYSDQAILKTGFTSNVPFVAGKLREYIYLKIGTMHYKNMLNYQLVYLNIDMRIRVIWIISYYYTRNTTDPQKDFTFIEFIVQLPRLKQSLFPIKSSSIKNIIGGNL